MGFALHPRHAQDLFGGGDARSDEPDAIVDQETHATLGGDAGEVPGGRIRLHHPTELLVHYEQPVNADSTAVSGAATRVAAGARAGAWHVLVAESQRHFLFGREGRRPLAAVADHADQA